MSTYLMLHSSLIVVMDAILHSRMMNLFQISDESSFYLKLILPAKDFYIIVLYHLSDTKMQFNQESEK